MSDRPRSGAYARFSMFITTLLILGVIVLVVGLWLDWFAIRTGTREVGAQDEWRLSLVVNPQQFNESVAQVGQELEELTQKAKSVGKTRTIEAVVESVDADLERVTVTDEDGEMRVFAMDETTDVQLDGKDVALTDLAAGDKVTVLVRVNKGERTLLSIDAERRDADKPVGDAAKDTPDAADDEDGAPRE